MSLYVRILAFTRIFFGRKKDKIKASSSQKHCISKMSTSKIGLLLSQCSIDHAVVLFGLDLNVVTSDFKSSEFLRSYTAILVRLSVWVTYSSLL